MKKNIEEPEHYEEIEEIEEAAEVEDVEDLEEIESPEEISEEPATFTDKEQSHPTKGCEAHQKLDSPFLRPLISTMTQQTFPAVLVSRNLEILWENDAYRKVFGHSERELPINLTDDFAPDLGPEKAGRIYSALGDPEKDFNHREQLQSIKRNRLTVVANAHFSPLFLESDSNSPCFFMVYFDIVTEEQKLLLQKTFLSLLEASKLKDNDTGKHISRVGEYSRRIAEVLYHNNPNSEVTLEFIHNIHFLAPMHDVGKIGTPDDILNKTGPLDDREWVIMKEHTINGAYIMNTYPDPMAKQIALHHHERWDGEGYPYQFEGEMIPLASRIVSVADVYDALRMKRSYKEAFSHKMSMEIIAAGKGTQFDPSIIETFTGIAEEIRDIRDNLKDQDEE